MSRGRSPFPSGERFLPFLRRAVRLAPRERAAIAIALVAFLLVSVRRWRGWL